MKGKVNKCNPEKHVGWGCGDTSHGEYEMFIMYIAYLVSQTLTPTESTDPGLKY
jgi:hypothetical protein